jgi:hypothetical protein
VYLGYPSTRQGIAVRQIGYVPEVRIRGWDEAGRPLVLQAEGQDVGIPGSVAIDFPTPQAQPLLFLPRQDMFLALSFEPSCAEGRPALYVDLLRNGGADRQRVQTLYESGSAAFEGLRLEVDLAYRPILRVDYRPGMAMAIVGLILALVSVALSWAVVPRMVWIAVGPGEDTPTMVHMLALPDVRDRSWLLRLARRLREGLADDD